MIIRASIALYIAEQRASEALARCADLHGGWLVPSPLAASVTASHPVKPPERAMDVPYLERDVMRVSMWNCGRFL